jgi:hypothetical protein
MAKRKETQGLNSHNERHPNESNVGVAGREKGHFSLQENNMEDEQETKEEHFPMSRQEAGRLGAKARWSQRDRQDHHNHKREEEERHPMSRQEAGRMGAEARWGRHHGERHSQSHQEHHPMTRQEAGRLGAEARWGTYRSEARSKRVREKHPPMTRQEAGRMGAEARWGRRRDQDDNRYERERKEYHSMSRFDAGRRRGEERSRRYELDRPEEDPRDLFYRDEGEYDYDRQERPEYNSRERGLDRRDFRRREERYRRRS